MYGYQKQNQQENTHLEKHAFQKNTKPIYSAYPYSKIAPR